MTDLVQNIIEAAKLSFNEKNIKEATERYTEKLGQLHRAKKVVANIEREIEDLELEMKNDVL